MDFGFSEEQGAIRDLAAKIFADHATVERIRAVEAQVDAGGEWFLESAWRALAEASLVGLALSEDVGGSGLGLIELCIML
ncbi:MAG: acyl-CoA dehydrogenase family protein, partial [Myxococcales bacterium]|nr:acyl-CoA dehydrogenase family protein [Myxococcales bacterium]